jgi:hypothetical protein
MHQNKSLLILFAISALLTLLTSETSAGEIGLNIYGLSYHYESLSYRDGRELKDYNQLNLGLGVQYIFSQSKKNIWFAESGFYKDSKYTMTIYIAPGYKYRFTESLSVGAGLVLFVTETYPMHVAPIPVLSYRVNIVTLSMTWIPAPESDESGAIGIYLTVRLKRLP